MSIRNSSHFQAVIRQQEKMEGLINKKDYRGAFWFRPGRTPKRIREEEEIPLPEEILSDGSRHWSFGGHH